MTISIVDQNQIKFFFEDVFSGVWRLFALFQYELRHCVHVPHIAGRQLSAIGHGSI